MGKESSALQKVTEHEKPKVKIPVIASNPLLFFAIILILVIVNFVAQRLFDWIIWSVYAEIGFSILALLIPWIVAFLYRQIHSLFSTLEKMVDLPSEQIDTWFECQMNFIFEGFWVYIVSVLFSIAGTWTMLKLGLPWSRSIDVIFLVFWSIFMWATGIVAWVYLGLLLFLYRFSNLKVKGKPFEWPEKEYKYINSSYIRMFLPGVFLYVGIVFSLWATGSQGIILYHPLGRLWIFPMAGAVISFFLAFQYFIHKSMSLSKQSRLDEIDRLLKELYARWHLDFSAERAKTISELMNWRRNIDQERDWPLNLQSNFAIISGLLLPTIKTIIDFFPH